MSNSFGTFDHVSVRKVTKSVIKMHNNSANWCSE